MAKQRVEKAEVDGDAEPGLNQVLIRGRVAEDPSERELPSGDVLWTVRVVVRREGDRRGPVRKDGRPRAAVDALDCAAWTRRAQRPVAGWRAGDQVEVTGAIRRRFFHGPGGVQSRVEIEIESGRRLSRASSA